MTHSAAINVLIGGGIKPSFAQQLLSVAEEFGTVHLPNLGPGPDSWGSTMELDVMYRKGHTPPEYSVKFNERKHY